MAQTKTDEPDIARTLQELEGEGVATSLPRPSPLVHFHAARLRSAGDVVMAMSRHVDPQAFAPSAYELRVFRADAESRATLPSVPGDELLQREGGLVWARVELPAVGEGGGERPAASRAQLTAFHLAGSTADERAAHTEDGLAEWVWTTLEMEVLLGGYSVLEAAPEAFCPPQCDEAGSDFEAWAREWLRSREYAVLDTSRIAKLLAPLPKADSGAAGT